MFRGSYNPWFRLFPSCRTASELLFAGFLLRAGLRNGLSSRSAVVGRSGERLLGGGMYYQVERLMEYGRDYQNEG